MNQEEKAEHPSALFEDELNVDAILRSIAEQFDVIMGKPQRVAEGCSHLRNCLSDPPTAADLFNICSLLPLLAQRSGPLVSPLFELFEEFASSCPAPWPLVKGMCAALDQSLAKRALELAEQLADAGSFVVDHDVIRFLAEQVEVQGKPLNETDLLPLIGKIVRHLDVEERDPVLSLFLEEKDKTIRRLAARILDLAGEPVSPEISKEILGNESAAFLAPYLVYTRATHCDLLSLISSSDAPLPAVHSLRQAQKVVDETLLRKIIAEAGWQRINLGIEIRHYVRVALGESMPLMLSPAEAALFESCGEVRRTSDIFLVLAHGGIHSEKQEGTSSDDTAARFRDYNLAHAEVLADFLAIAPLTGDKIRSMLQRMDRIVRDFIALFSSYADECQILSGIYEQIKKAILTELNAHADDGTLSPDLTRLVMMFEDPHALGEISTLHSLKRYVHQKGLQLGFRLVLRSRSTNRSVDLLLASRERILFHLKNIRYMDFEPDENLPGTKIPYPVAVVAEGFARQLLFGHESFPRVDIFCYGNEVHYYLSFRNHPAFLRINFAPPLQGGMIDLEYYGISKYELSVHPNISLDALRRFFRYLEFDIQIESTRVHARYDKENAHTLESLYEKAEAIFRLAPYLLDIDWIIGGFKLDSEARQKVAEAWAESFAHWGVLPLRDILTEDRLGIIESVATTVTGKQEITWSGNGAYRDCFSGQPSEDFLEKLSAKIDLLEIGIAPVLAEESQGRMGQILERRLLLPLRQSVARGELIETHDGYERTSSDLFQRVSEAEHFAEILASGDDSLYSAAVVACLIIPLERILDFCTTGRIAGREVQSAQLSLGGGELGIYVVRGEKNVIGLAFYTHGSVLFRCRKSVSDPWSCNGKYDAVELLSLLRRANYPTPVYGPLPQKSGEEIRRIRHDFAQTASGVPRKLISGERIISGVRASPGRAVGKVLFGTTHRTPEDFDGGVLVAAAIRPEDNTFLYHAAGIVSTGGGILSHAGLLAAQFRKPAIIISGRWKLNPDGTSVFCYRSMEYDEHEKEICGYSVSIRKRIRERECILREGDLVVLDVVEGELRVLGQDVDTLALHEGLHLFGTAALKLSQAAADLEILMFRGRLLRARHQIEKILTRLTDPVLACHAIHELLFGRYLANRCIRSLDKAHLLNLILQNSAVGENARNFLRWSIQKLHEHFAARLEKAEHDIPDSRSIYEILNLRLDALRAHQSLQETNSCLIDCGFEGSAPEADRISVMDQLADDQLRKLKKHVTYALADRTCAALRRHQLRQLETLDRLIGASGDESKLTEAHRQPLFSSDHARREKYSNHNIILPEDGGFELYPFIGWKAANLAELRHMDNRVPVPAWFVISDYAFRQVLESPMTEILTESAELSAGSSSLRQAIEAILDQSKLDYAQKSSQIRSLWDAVILPEKITEEILAAYRMLGEQESSVNDIEPYVAIRSSSHEEDSEIAARAGEFDTFLYIRGANNLLDYLKRTWSGLWNERAIHNRVVLGSGSPLAGGGVIVQRIVHSRVSGVVQTIDVARNEAREIVINAGLGLGEGIVSGTVAADQITVSKEGEPEKKTLHFSCVTADKKEYVIFNKRTGLGTMCGEAPYHRRLRPALEYVELSELVNIAVRLEAAYGYPLDLEFGIEGSQIWILQVRPVPAFSSALQETLQDHPLARSEGTLNFSKGEKRYDQI